MNLPGGGGVDLGGGGGDEPAPAPTPAPTPTTPTTPTPAPSDGSTEPTTEAPATTGGGGGGGRGTGESAGHRHHGGRTDQDSEGPIGTGPGQVAPPTLRDASGAPAPTNPSLTVADFGPAPIGVPNLVIDQFSIPPFLLPIYQACGTQYGIPWQVLASINRIETAFGTNLNVSTAGALGWMQFMPATWKTYGVDANNDGRKDPFNPVDAICAAARYLKAAGGDTDLRTAIFAYNHADWYVDEVLLYANQYERLPADLVSSLTGLTEGARFPVAADSRYADDIAERRLLKRAENGHTVDAKVSESVASSPKRRAVDVFADQGSPVLAVNDGVIKKIGHSPSSASTILQDTYGNRYTYAQLGRTSKAYPAPRDEQPTGDDYKLPSDRAGAARTGRPGWPREHGERQDRRMFALPDRRAMGGSGDMGDSGMSDGQAGLGDTLFGNFPNFERFRAYTSGILKFNRKTMELRPLREGAQVVAGTLLGRVGPDTGQARAAPQLLDPAGRARRAIDRPEADPRRLEAPRGDGALPGRGQGPVRRRLELDQPDPAAVEGQLARQVLADPSLDIYECGRQDIADRADRPARAGAARVPRRPGLQAHDHLAQMRAL